MGLVHNWLSGLIAETIGVEKHQRLRIEGKKEKKKKAMKYFRFEFRVTETFYACFLVMHNGFLTTKVFSLNCTGFPGSCDL